MYPLNTMAHCSPQGEGQGRGTAFSFSSMQSVCVCVCVCVRRVFSYSSCLLCCFPQSALVSTFQIVCLTIFKHDLYANLAFYISVPPFTVLVLVAVSPCECVVSWHCEVLCCLCVLLCPGVGSVCVQALGWTALIVIMCACVHAQ